LNHRERLLGTIAGRGVDRPALPMWLGFSPWGETLERWRRESGDAELDVARHFGLDPFFAVAPAEYGPFPHFEPRQISEDAEFVVSTDWRGIARRQRKNSSDMPEWIGNPVKGPDDWKRYKEERLLPRLEERLAALPQWLAKVTPETAVQVGVFPWGVFGTARDILGAEELLLDFYSEPEMVRDIMETNVSLWLALYERIAQSVRIDHIHIWEDMSGRQGSLISPAMVEEFMMPQYDRLSEFARRRGVPLVSVDSDGRVDELVPVMMRHGVNAFFPFEVQAGSDVEAFRRDYPALGILGGLDKRALAAGKVEMHRELDRAGRMLAAGRYVPGFDHAIPPDVPWANFSYFVRELRKLTGAG
jgi:hypothetical protein